MKGLWTSHKWKCCSLGLWEYRKRVNTLWKPIEQNLPWVYRWDLTTVPPYHSGISNIMGYKNLLVENTVYHTTVSKTKIFKGTVTLTVS